VGRSEVDVAIVGNGAIACALALRLSAQQPTVRIALIGPSQRPGCASLAAGAMLSAFGELEVGSLDFPFARRKFEIARDASRMWGDHLALLNGRLHAVPPVTINQGTYVAASHAVDDSDVQTLDAIAAQLKAFDEPFREVDPADVPGLRPTRAHRPSRVLYLENEGTVSARHLHRAYDEAFSLLPNVAVLDDDVSAIDPGPRVHALATKRGKTLSAPHIVLAAGAFTQTFVDQLGLARKIPRIAFGAGTSLVVKALSPLPDKVFRSPNRGLACGVYCVPYRDGYCYLGATTRLLSAPTTADALSNMDLVRELLGAASGQVNITLDRAEIHKTILGYRPTTMDTFPLFGETSIAGVWIASGTKRDGFHLSPKVADELATAIVRRAQPFAGAFVPERLLLLEVPKEVAIARAVTLLAAAERRTVGGARSSDADLHASVNDAYVRAGLSRHDFGIPPELLPLYASGFAGANIEALLAQKQKPGTNA
jgi:glycine oxidase